MERMVFLPKYPISLHCNVIKFNFNSTKRLGRYTFPDIRIIPFLKTFLVAAHLKCPLLSDQFFGADLNFLHFSKLSDAHFKTNSTFSFNFRKKAWI